MRVLVGTLSLVRPAGTETYVLTVAHELRRLGHEPVLWGEEQGPLAEEAERRGLVVARTEAELPRSVDAILANDGPSAARLAARYPEVRLVLGFDNQPIVHLPDEVDVAIRAGDLPDSDLIARRVASTMLWTCASAGYLAAHGTPSTVEELRGHTLVTLFDHRSTWRFHTAAGDVREFAAEPGLVVPEHAIARTLLIGGAGIGQLPEYHAREAVANGSLVRILPDHQGERVDVHALYPRHRSLSAKVRVFVDALTAHLSPRRVADGGSAPERMQ